MTAFEIVTTIFAVISILISFGMFLIALFAFLDKRSKHK